MTAGEARAIPLGMEVVRFEAGVAVEVDEEQRRRFEADPAFIVEPAVDPTPRPPSRPGKGEMETLAKGVK